VLDVKEDKKGSLPRTYQKPLKPINQNWKPEIQCRLDFFLISSDLICDINLADIVPGYKTDHSMILLKIALHYNPSGRGFWKLNVHLAPERGGIFELIIKTTIYQTKTIAYAAATM